MIERSESRRMERSHTVQSSRRQYVPDTSVDGVASVLSPHPFYSVTVSERAVMRESSVTGEAAMCCEPGMWLGKGNGFK